MVNEDTKVIKEFPPIQKAEGEQIRVSYRSYKDYPYLDIRTYYLKKELGEYLPSQKGITLRFDDTMDFISELHNDIGEIIGIAEKELKEEEVKENV